MAKKNYGCLRVTAFIIKQEDSDPVFLCDYHFYLRSHPPLQIRIWSSGTLCIPPPPPRKKEFSHIFKQRILVKFVHIPARIILMSYQQVIFFGFF